eukprot:11119784-Alexandrium_andersonii.AAC.1
MPRYMTSGSLGRVAAPNVRQLTCQARLCGIGLPQLLNARWGAFIRLQARSSCERLKTHHKALKCHPPNTD